MKLVDYQNKKFKANWFYHNRLINQTRKQMFKPIVNLINKLKDL